MTEGTRLATARRGNGLSQQALADMSHISLSAIQKIEAGDRAMTRENAVVFADVLGLQSPYELLDFTGKESVVDMTQWLNIFSYQNIDYKTLADHVMALEGLFCPIPDTRQPGDCSALPDIPGKRRFAEVAQELRKAGTQVARVSCEADSFSGKPAGKYADLEYEDAVMTYNEKLISYQVAAREYVMNLSRFTALWSFMMAARGVLKAIVMDDDMEFGKSMSKWGLDKIFQADYEKIRCETIKAYDAYFGCGPGEMEKHRIKVEFDDDNGGTIRKRIVIPAFVEQN